MTTNFSKEKIIICLTVFIDVLGFSIVIPILPYYVEKIGLGAFGVTALFSVFSLFSFLSSPLIGVLSDHYGRRPALIASITSTSLGWFVFAAAHNPLLLFLGRIIDGLAAGNFSVAQSYLVDLASDEQERTKNLGLIAAIFGISFMLGPMLGALLSMVSLAFPFWFVGVMAAINALGAYFFLPESNHRKRSGILAEALNPFGPLLRATKEKLLRAHYLAWLFFGLALASMQSVFALYLHTSFGIEAQGSAWIFAGMGVVMAFNQVVGLRRFWLKKFTEKQLETWLFPLLALAMLLAGIKILPILLIGLLLNGLTQSVLRVVMSSRVAGFAPKERKGEVLGVMSSIMFVAMTAGPLLAGKIFTVDPSWPFFLATLFLLAAFVVMLRCCRNDRGQYIKEEVTIFG